MWNSKAANWSPSKREKILYMEIEGSDMNEYLQLGSHDNQNMAANGSTNHQSCNK